MSVEIVPPDSAVRRVTLTSGRTDVSGAHEARWIQVTVAPPPRDHTPPSSGGFASGGQKAADAGFVMDRHLRVRLPAPLPCPELADVVVARGGGPEAVRRLAREHPNALVAAAHMGTRCWVTLGGGTDALLELGPQQFAGLPWQTWASLLHAWRVAGLSVQELWQSSLTVRRLSRTRGGVAGGESLQALRNRTRQHTGRAPTVGQPAFRLSREAR
ncbi:hypothetical protein SALCHL_002745 [Streptomyces albus subsp. chlorinus]|uniref:hypothetical protein n=1 Tax=Streptomyces albus TaxID=1888 RepID=UPI00156D81D9|nr:hypothetical protein [Streptomyces albus]